ncbi:MAG: histidine ammonia-lyase [Acidobacteria bacterium]|nr:histidine ammonia-lyase [Acidobacteriota bacterium]
MTVTLTGDPLGIDEVVAVARRGEDVAVAGTVAARMAPARRLVEECIARGDAVYGITTGFGALANVRISAERTRELQCAIVRSHAAGAGDPMPDEVVRAMMLLRARTLAAGHAGARPVVVERIVSLLNAGIHPVVPEHGSVGASGDLAPLAHCALALIGEGEVRSGGERLPAARALAAAGIEPLRLEAKEGLALVNGTEGMLAMLCLALSDLRTVLATADVVCAMSVEALLATDRPFAEAIHRLRPHPGQAASAAHLRRLTAGSPLIASHRTTAHAVQDAYSLRCAPQVHGACRDLASHARGVAEVELASEVDNPVVLHEIGAVESAGNFHGEPLAFALDALAIAAAEVASISERRTDRLLDPAHSNGLPPFLAPEAGVNSGFMLAQYTAAALVAEGKRLAVPASVDSIPTSGTTEDHVSMGWGAGRKALCAVRNAATVLAVEALCAAQALDLRAPTEPSAAVAAARAAIRRVVPRMDADRSLAPDIEAVADLVRERGLVAAAEGVIGPIA